MEEESDKINGGNSDIPLDPLQSLKSRAEMERNIERTAAEEKRIRQLKTRGDG